MKPRSGLETNESKLFSDFPRLKLRLKEVSEARLHDRRLPLAFFLIGCKQYNSNCTGVSYTTATKKHYHTFISERACVQTGEGEEKEF